MLSNSDFSFSCHCCFSILAVPRERCVQTLMSVFGVLASCNAKNAQILLWMRQSVGLKKHTSIKWSKSVSHEEWVWYRSPFVSRWGNWEFIIPMLPFLFKGSFCNFWRLCSLWLLFRNCLRWNTIITSEYVSLSETSHRPPQYSMSHVKFNYRAKTSWQSSLHVSFSLTCSCWFGL